MQLNYQVDISVLNETNNSNIETLYKKKWNNIHSIKNFTRPFFNNKFSKLKFWLSSFIKSPFTPLTLSYFNNNQLQKKILEYYKDSNYDFIIFDGLHAHASFLKFLEVNTPHIIYRAHNVESDLWFTAAHNTKNIILKIGFNFQGLLMKKFENNLCSISSKIWCISDEDEKVFNKISKKTELIPVGMNFSRNLQKRETSYYKFLFLGKLDWSPNKNGLEWFLDNIWPIHNQSFPHNELHIVGSGNKDYLKKYSRLNKVIVHGFVKDLNDLYSHMDLSLMPIFFGSGTRIKVIESISKHTPMISTQMGVQGSGLLSEDYIEAETKEEWIKALEVLDDKKLELIKNNAFNRLQSKLSYEAIAKKISTTFS